MWLQPVRHSFLRTGNRASVREERARRALASVGLCQVLGPSQKVGGWSLVPGTGLSLRPTLLCPVPGSSVASRKCTSHRENTAWGTVTRAVQTCPAFPACGPQPGQAPGPQGGPCSGQQAEALPLHPGLQASRLLPLCSLHSAPCPCPSAVRTSCRKPLWEGWCPWEGSRVGAGLPEAGSDQTEPPVQTG